MVLNSYSEAVRVALAERSPWLLPELREQSDGSLYLELLSPSGYKFWLSTEGGEVTVGFDLHHRHFGTPWEPDAAEDVREASEYIDQLINGQCLIAVWRRNGKFVQSETIQPGESLDRRTRSFLSRWWLRGCTVEVRGW